MSDHVPPFVDNGFSFENITQTHIGRLNLEFSDVTSVSFTLCTFKDMTNSNTNGGGAAISIREFKSSLTVSSCFFLRCISTAEQHLLWRESRRVPCIFDGDRPLFFELSKADEDGAMRVESEIVKISHSVFVECSAYQNAGAINIESVSGNALDVHFRGKGPLFSNTSSQITSEMIVFCDSTSGTPNVCLYRLDGNYLIPQISPTHTVKSVDVSFDGDEATVTVQTDKAIKGTLNLLLDGSNVPRLVHVVGVHPHPPSLTDVSANIMKYKQQYAFLLLYFDREVRTTAETEEFVVVGDDRILTHDTTYTIKSIITTPGSESMPVLMSDPISFHIPKSSYVLTEEPETQNHNQKTLTRKRCRQK
ncbi:hypothetical protein BLNAU_25274 [Blattamonas nauphoetae]|uniref:Uncharacterized protein n=1 Tax=Blattamonas nauphoetae TaxID=2049346 RepID=A0ABQ9WK24_9EUKA|nr:hypothetical protein BLNAU_25274 [Blattamonas nauphoetae]